MTAQTEETVRSHRIGRDGLLVLSVHDGHVRVRGTTGDVATVRSADGRTLDGLEIEPGERSLTIRSSPRADASGPGSIGPGPRERGNAGRRRTKDLHLDVPAGAKVIVEGASADVDVQGMHGDQRYRSASGDLVLAGVRGSLRIEAVSGDIAIGTDGPSAVLARTVSGDLELRAGSITHLKATTTSGDVDITGRFEGEGPFAIETVSGDATLAPINGIRVEARTITGDLDSDLASRRDDAPGRRAMVIGVGGPTVTFRSTSGDLRVVAATGPDPVIGVGGPAAPPIPPATTPPAPPPPPALEPTPAPADVDDGRLTVLRQLESGDIDVAEAGRRLEALDAHQPPAERVREERDHA